MIAKMPTTNDAETNDGEGGLSKRVSKRVQEADFVYQGRTRERGSSKKRTVKGRQAQELFLNRLVKIELDAVQALADFSRLTRIPCYRSPTDLKWSVKRKRSRRSYDAFSVKVEPRDTQNYGIPFGDSQRSTLDSTTSLSHSDKVSPPFDCRAESPSSPLPSSNLACRAFLLNGGLSSKSAFQRVARAEPVQKPCLTSIKTETEDLQPESLPPTRQKPRCTRASVSSCLVKPELLGKREKKCKGAGAKTLGNLDSRLVEFSHEVGWVVLNKPKAGLTEKDKEARRHRRIQANRESARQTIWKKQILCEDLRQKAVSLASENECMKQKKEALMQELFFLKGQNYHLKAKLEMGPTCKLEPGMQQQSQGISMSSSGWQAPSLACIGSPSHVLGWPRMMTQLGVADCVDWLNKMENWKEHSRNLASNDPMQMQLLNTELIVQGTPSSNSICVTGGAERNSSCIVNDMMSSPHEASGAAATKMSSGTSCDVELVTLNDEMGLGKEVNVISPMKSAYANAMQERGILCRPTAIVPFRGDVGLGEKQSNSKTLENTENLMGLPVARGASYTSSIGAIPMNGQGLADMYSRRTTQQTAEAAAAARKRRMELMRKKRSCSNKRIEAGCVNFGRMTH